MSVRLAFFGGRDGDGAVGRKEFARGKDERFDRIDRIFVLGTLTIKVVKGTKAMLSEKC